ncbi:bifunctional riboflavin kinase/FAD synthetase [Clostridium omnivorum]|uniref:Riboflavin biosynthesis protein n=1 Tax=Clostridium omnivorum TaxID=1604902 RepID=A0ABQ5NBQ9_9CLOT|nr:bifunctional riboflavin kinase/FAD synthetase [Clostridium sp. E14]GLC32700.1 riboflavin biosynthesis protein [Clostridium sp. E14]
MIVLEDKFNTKIEYKTYVALGSFDGLHSGHIGLISKTIELAKSNNAKSMIYTFKEHPLMVLNRDIAPKLIMNNNTKLEILEELSVDVVNLVPFDDEYMRMPAEVFIEKLVEYYNVVGIIVGFNFKFGYKNSGNVELLKSLSEKLGFTLHVIDPITKDGEVVSSSCIREQIKNGEVENANKLLIKPYMLDGTVVKGKQLGRILGFPTANLKYNLDFVIPGNGVYYTIIAYESKFYKGITNVGYNPSVGDTNNSLTIETYILDFDKDIYGEYIKVYFIKKFRDEIKFSSLDQLVSQLKSDKEYAEKQILEIF